MSPDTREPLGDLSLNASPLFVTPPSSSSASSSARKSATYVPPKARRLAPIFTSRSSNTSISTPNVASSSSQASASSPFEPTTPTSSDPYGSHARLGSPMRKRARISLRTSLDVEPDACLIPGCQEDNGTSSRRREDEMTRYFVPTTPTRAGRRVKPEPLGDVPPAASEDVVMQDGWVRRKRRTGIAAFRGRMTGLDSIRPIEPPIPYLSTFVHSLIPFMPTAPPSSILLTSIHPPTGRQRDWSPALSVQFSHTAKHHTASSARETGLRRLLAVSGEEGGVRIVDIDAPQGTHREEGGWWWRAHANAVFDTRWSGDDAKIMTTSGDQTTRLHALDSASPTLTATLRGHTSSVKTATFFDPLRTADDASKGSVVATAGRDGSILIFDLRCSGRRLSESGDDADEYASRRSNRERERYSAGLPGFTPNRQGVELDPVMAIRGAHAESGRRVTARTVVKSVTSLIALQSMPGMLASAGSADGIVKLWDLRFPAGTARHPGPRPSYSAAASLPDPTVFGAPASRRPRGIHSIVESPLTGDLYVLAGDSRIHTLRPSCAFSEDRDQAILPGSFSDDSLRASSFYVRMSLSPDGRCLAAGSGKGEVVTFDTQSPQSTSGQGKATRLPLGQSVGCWPEGRTREVSSVDWGQDCLAASSDDMVTRIWRSELGVAKGMKEDKEKWSGEWIGAVSGDEE